MNLRGKKARPQTRLIDIENQLATCIFELFLLLIIMLFYFSIETEKMMKTWVGNRFMEGVAWGYGARGVLATSISIIWREKHSQTHQFQAALMFPDLEVT